MTQIDFLPESYRHRRLQKRGYVWELGVLVLFGSVVALTASAQMANRWQVARQLQKTNLEYKAAQSVHQSHEELQARVALVSQRAELYTYLQHPWPRTQVLASVLACLPEKVSLTRFSITPDTMQAVPVVATADAAKEEKLTAPQQDLKRLRGEYGQRACVVSLAGIADDAGEVHEFARLLAASPLVEHVKIESVEDQLAGNERRIVFRLRGTLKPAIGQQETAAPQTTTTAGMR